MAQDENESRRRGDNPASCGVLHIVMDTDPTKFVQNFVVPSGLKLLLSDALPTTDNCQQPRNRGLFMETSLTARPECGPGLGRVVRLQRVTQLNGKSSRAGNYGLQPWTAVMSAT